METQGDVNPFRYCGEYFDLSSGTYYLRSRYYDPTIGRFTQRDAFLGFYNDPLSLNRYLYCSHNPIKYRDPWGDWQVGDEKYDLATQEIIMQATQDYYAAPPGPAGDAQRKAANATANAARAAGTTGTQPSGVTPGTIYNDAISNSKNGFMTLDDFKAADQKIKETAPQWSYLYTLEAITAAQAIDIRYADVAKNNNMDLLLKDQGPNSSELFALTNYWFLVYNVQYLKSTLHIMGDNLQLTANNPANQEALDRWYVDTSGKTLQDKGYAVNSSSGDAVQISISGNTINMDIQLWISGSGANLSPTGSTMTYRELTIAGMRDDWSGKYWIDGRWVQVTADVHGVTKVRDYISVEIIDDHDTSNVNNGGNWRTGYTGLNMASNRGVMTLYRGETSDYSASIFRRVASHELGHILGIGDAYEPRDKSLKAADDKDVSPQDRMKAYIDDVNSRTSVLNILAMVEAENRGTWVDIRYGRPW